jgi:hypothetical protein
MPSPTSGDRVPAFYAIGPLAARCPAELLEILRDPNAGSHGRSVDISRVGGPPCSSAVTAASVPAARQGPCSLLL